MKGLFLKSLGYLSFIQSIFKKFGDDVGNELNSKNLSQIFYFFPFFLRYSVCSGNLAQKHYYEFKIEFKNNKALKYKSQTHYFCLICSDHVPRKKKRVD